MALSILTNFNQRYIEFVTGFFEWYNQAGRSVLDFFHITFDTVFNILLVVAFIASLLYLFMAIYSLFSKRKPSKIENNDFFPSVTIQIPTFNELVAIRCAKACLEFDYPKDKFEIIIGDDSTQKDVSKKIDEFARKHSQVKVTRRGSNAGFKPGNLNHMLKFSKGEFLVIFDSDFDPDPDFLRRLIAPFKDNENLAGVQARWKLINPSHNMITVLGATIVVTCHHITLPFLNRRRDISFLCGSAEAVRKELVINLGRWEEGNLTEDIEFSLRLLEKGYKINYLEDLECRSEVPYTLKDLYRQQMRWAYGVIYSWIKHFKAISKSKKLNFIDKFYMGGIFCSGYLLSVLLAGLFTMGTLSFITHEPAPIEWGRFFFEMARNIVLTSGLIIASVVALKKAKQSRLTMQMVASSFSYGLVVTYYVNIGIFKAIAKRPMEWFMLKKQGNYLTE